MQAEGLSLEQKLRTVLMIYARVQCEKCTLKAKLPKQAKVLPRECFTQEQGAVTREVSPGTQAGSESVLDDAHVLLLRIEVTGHYQDVAKEMP